MTGAMAADNGGTRTIAGAGEEELVRPRCEPRRVFPASGSDRCAEAGGDTAEVEPVSPESATAIPTAWGPARDNPNTNAAAVTLIVLVRAIVEFTRFYINGHKAGESRQG